MSYGPNWTVRQRLLTEGWGVREFDGFHSVEQNVSFICFTFLLILIVFLFFGRGHPIVFKLQYKNEIKFVLWHNYLFILLLHWLLLSAWLGHHQASTYKNLKMLVRIVWLVNLRLKKSNEMQQYADIYLLLNYSTCFGRPSRPSSAVHKTRCSLWYRSYCLGSKLPQTWPNNEACSPDSMICTRGCNSNFMYPDTTPPKPNHNVTHRIRAIQLMK